MCPPKVKAPPRPMPAPTPADAELNADNNRQRLAARRGFAAMVKTTSRGAVDYGMNSQGAGLGGGTNKLLGSNR